MPFIGKGGGGIIVGLYGGAASLPLPLPPMRAVTDGGSGVGSLSEMTALLSLGRGGAPQPLPSESHPLLEAGAVLASLRAGRIMGRAVVKPD